MKFPLLSSALAVGVALPALAQTTPPAPSPAPFQTQAAGASVSASDLIGARIYASEAPLTGDAYAGQAPDWSDIGEVNDIILGRDGSVDAVLVDIGGFLGIGERTVAVDMAALRFVQNSTTDADDWFLVTQASRPALDAAPEWQPAAANPVATDPAATNPVTAPMSEGTAPLSDGYVRLAPEALTAEMLKGATVRDGADTAIAEVSDLILTPEGKVTDVVVDVGGFLGIGARQVAIPIDKLEVAQSADGKVLVHVTATREELEALPPLKP